jgi:PAS domain S-box-containing protein
MTPIATEEEARVGALRSCAILDTATEPDFDDLVRMAATVADVPRAAIAFVDETRWWAKAWVGDITQEQARHDTLCAAVVEGAARLVLDDAADAEPGALREAASRDAIRFYAGFPLVLPEGVVAGVLSVSDVRPRTLSDDQLVTLQLVAQQVMRLVSFRRHAALIAESYEALALGEAQYRLIANTASDAIVTIDDDGHILFANPAVSRIFGYEVDELLGRHITTLVPARDREDYARRFAEQVRGRGPSVALGGARLQGLHKDGRELPMELSCGEGQVGLRRFFTGIIRDVSCREVFEQALIAAREAAVTTSRLKSEFLANMSHEIRTPMNGVTGMLELLLEDSLTEEQRGRAGVALESAQSLLTIINDILDLSKIEAGKFELSPEWTDIRPIVDSVIGLLRPRVAAGVRLDGTCSADVPPRVFVDAVRFRQVLTNLAGNAVKFTERGQISVLVHAPAAMGGRADLRMTVTDTGVGVAADLLPKMFDKFTQADGSANRRAGGTGLGLSISRRLVDMMGGRLDVTSEVGRGSEFSFSLSVPCSSDDRPMAVEGAAPAPDARRTDGARVLLVEDNPVNQQFACAVLASIGCNVSVAKNGEEAVSMVASQPFDVVLMDCQMPVMDGYEATRRIRARGSRVPIVALTAHAMDGDRARCAEAGMDDYLAKPIRPDTLRTAVTRVVLREPPSEAPVAAMLDEAAILDRLSGDRDLLVDIGRIFIEHCPSMVASLTEARDAGDAVAIAAAAHAIKGSVGNFTDGRAFQLAREAEQRGRNGDAAAAATVVPDLVEELGRVCVALDALINEEVRT